MNPLKFTPPATQAVTAAAMVRQLQSLPELQLLLDAERQKKQARLDVLREQLNQILASADQVSAEHQAQIDAAEARAVEAQNAMVVAAREVEALKSKVSGLRAAALQPKAKIQQELRVLEAALAPPAKEEIEMSSFAVKPELPPMVDDRFRPRG
jgi:hypothetical protein